MPINRLSPIINGQLTGDEIFVRPQHYYIRINIYIICFFTLLYVRTYVSSVYGLTMF